MVSHFIRLQVSAPHVSVVLLSRVYSSRVVIGLFQNRSGIDVICIASDIIEVYMIIVTFFFVIRRRNCDSMLIAVIIL